MTDDKKKKIEELLTRSIDTIYPDRKTLESALYSGKKLRIYMGIDPTSTYVHIGHSTNYIVLRRLHELGHKIIVLIGDFTAMIGDPSDKSAARVQLTREQVKKNFKTYKDQIGKILDFNDKKNPIEVRYNSEWLSKLDFEDIAKLASNFTAQQFLDREGFQKRLKENKPLYLHEFLYPLMQGYDSVALDVDIEVEGTDQIFNMLAGKTLMKALKNKEKISVATTLLVNPVTGEKLMHKSLGTGIGLNDSPKDMFGKTMALPDEAIIQVYIDCTFKTMDEIKEMEKELKNGANPRDLKAKLAYELVKMYHSETDAKKAQEEFERVFKNKETPEDMAEIKITDTKLKLIDLVSKTKLAPSNSQARRLIQQGAVKIDNQKQIDPDKEIDIKNGMVVQVGKRRFAKIIK